MILDAPESLEARGREPSAPTSPREKKDTSP
jgi:hypothetical protein